MELASIQMEIGDRDKKANLDRAGEFIDATGHADLILLPELWNIGYFSFDAYEAGSETIEGPTMAFLRQKAVEKGCFLFGGSFVESKEGRLYNTSALIDRKGQIVAIYRKIHLYGHQSEEAKLLGRGSEICVMKTELGVFGLSTCYDLRFPELYRKMATMGAEIFLVASAWPFPRLEAWLMLNRVRALENLVFVVSSNCVGTNRGKQFVGHSMVVDPWGTPLATGGDHECIVRASIDPRKVHETRATFPAFSDKVLVEF